jgi:hypothetical protein
MLKSRTPKLAVAAFTIASAIGLTGTGAQALAATSAAGSTTATSPTVTSSTATPDFTCADRTVCVWQDANFSGPGIVESFPTADDSEQWINLVSPGGVPLGMELPWGSFNNNSGSSVVFGDAQSDTGTCYLPDTRISEPSVVHDRYMWIEFGNTGCNGSVGSLPGDTGTP